MYNSVSIDSIPGTSKLFKEFFKNSEYNKLDSLQNKIYDISKKNYNRELLIETIKSSSVLFNLNELQINNLQLLSQNSTLAVVSGQQAGFMGGSLYTLLKSLDTVKTSKRLKSLYPEKNFVPIFWVEDNDNDLDEVASAILPDESYTVKDFVLNFIEKTVVSKTNLSDNHLEVVKEFSDYIKKFRYGNEIEEIISSSYNGKYSLSESFTILMNKLIGHTGILFLSASKIMETGIFKSLIYDELTNIGRSFNSVERKNKELESKGYHIQANVSEVNLFYHINNQRFRIDIENDGYKINNTHYTRNEFLEIVSAEPDKFSPKVLLRPIFQDYCIPTILYIAGPGEIAYHSQLDYLYQDFELIKPAIFMRTSLTVLDKKIARYLNKLGLQPEYFRKNFREIEKEVTLNLLGESHSNMFNEFKSNFKEHFDMLEEYLLKIDSQLDRTIKGTFVKITEQIELLDKKSFAAAKRINEETLHKYKSISNFLFPNEKLQERVFSLLYFVAADINFIEKLLNLDIESDNFHLFIELD